MTLTNQFKECVQLIKRLNFRMFRRKQSLREVHYCLNAGHNLQQSQKFDQ